jgi:hypothetical protein
MLSSLVIFLRWPNLYRRQFEHANLEAMDESAEWRMKYDTEFGRNRQLEEELLKVGSVFSVCALLMLHRFAPACSWENLCLQAKTTLTASAKRLESLQKVISVPFLTVALP